MPKTLSDGEKVTVSGSTSEYELQRLGSVYSCTCPAWRNQGAQIGFRTCKHLRAYLGDAHETARIGAPAPPPSTSSRKGKPAGTVTVGPGGVQQTTGGPPPILLAHKWETDHDPTGWWMSEKLDG